MTVGELRAILAGLPDELEVVRATPDGLYPVNGAETAIVDRWESGSLHGVLEHEEAIQ